MRDIDVAVLSGIAHIGSGLPAENGAEVLLEKSHRLDTGPAKRASAAIW